MKKFTTMIIAAGLALLMAVPALALDVGNLKFNGEYRARGFSHSAIDLDDDDKTSSYYDMRLRVKTTFDVTDHISLTTRFDALDKVWGDDDEDGSDIENIDFDVAYMTIKTPIGGFVVGRYPTSKFGTGLADSADNKDRIIYVLPIENWTFAAMMQKTDEFDKGTELSDADNHKYAIVSRYKGKNFTAGALLAIYDYETIPSPLQLDEYAVALGTAQQTQAAVEPMISAQQSTLIASQAAAATANATLAATIAANPADPTIPLLTAAAAGAEAQASADLATLTGLEQAYDNAVSGEAAIKDAGPATTELFAYVPEAFFIGKFGSFGIEAEIDYGTGKGENATDGKEDIDLSVLMYLAEATYDTGPFTFRGGYVYISGDEDPYDDKVKCFAYAERSADLDKTFILTGGDEDARVGAGLEQTLGGYGTVAAGEVTPFLNPAVRSGIKMMYAGLTYSPMENLSFDFVYANAKADEPAETIFVPDGLGGGNVMNRKAIGLGSIDDDMGSEYDFTLTWKCLDNLEYKFVAAYLDAGDFWQQGDDTDDIEDLYTFYNSLTLTF